MVHRTGWGALGLVAVLVAFLVAVAPAHAGPTFTVDSNGDQADASPGNGICATAGGACTLRAAMEEANLAPGTTIDFAPSVTGQILLTSTLPTIATTDLTIAGPGSDQLAIDGANTYRVLESQFGSSATISGLTIRHGNAGLGTTVAGGGINSGGNMTLDRVVVTQNTANGGTDAFGGGISVGLGTLTLRRSTVSDNTATTSGTSATQVHAYGGGVAVFQGGPALVVDHSTISGNTANGAIVTPAPSTSASGNGGGIYSGGPVTIDQSTISGNTASGSGGVSNTGSGGGYYGDNNGVLTMTGSTVSDNTVVGNSVFTDGANMYFIPQTGAATVRSSIVANPTGGHDCYLNGGTLVSGGFNLDEEGTCGFNQATDINGTVGSPVDPSLGALADNGGPTQTQALQTGSPAIDKGKSFGAATDQRGTPRISDSSTIANASGGDGADIGAYERDLTAPSVTAPVQSLLNGSQLGASGGTPSVPVHFAWSATDAVTPGPQLQSFLQMRTNSGGTWSPFSTYGVPTFAKSTNASFTGSVLRQFRVRAKDQAGNFGTSPPGPAFRVTVYQERNSAITYSGVWHQADQATASGGAVKYSTQAGAKATLTSTGRNLGVVMPWSPTRGTVRICLDPGTAAQSCGTVDLSPAPGVSAARKLVFVRNGRSPTATHKVVVTVLSGRADLDAFVALR